MKRALAAAFVSAIASLGLASEAAAKPAAVRLAEDIIRENVGRSYYALPIPRSDFRPGMVILARIQNGVFTPESIICRRALREGVEPGDPADLSVVNVGLDNDIDITFSLNLFNRVIGPENSARLGSTGIQFKNTVNISWGNVVETYYTRDQITPDALNPTCVSAIAGLQSSQRRRVYVIERAVSVTGFNYEQKTDNTGNLGGGATWNEVLSVEAGVNWALTGERTLSITAPRYVLITAPRFVDWQRSGQTSTGDPRFTFDLVGLEPGAIEESGFDADFPADPADQ